MTFRLLWNTKGDILNNTSVYNESQWV